MTPDDRTALLTTVRNYVTTHGEEATGYLIRDAHNGRPDGYLVTDANLHLFRQYRNEISSAPADLITEAMGTT